MIEDTVSRTGAGIILDAAVVHSLLVPAAVALFGRLNWWLSRMAARGLRITAPRRPMTDPTCA
jgi:RND superfamily putative drug exporter